jgi:hypothetical protein
MAVNGRRARRWIATVAFAGACVSAAAGLALFGAHTASRFDLTARGEHRLTDRALRTIDGLDTSAQIIVAVDHRRLDRRAIDRVHDVLDAFEATDRVTTARIDTGGPRGGEALRSLADELVERERASIDAGLEQSDAVLAALGAITADLDRLSGALRDLGRTRAGAGAWADQRAAVARVARDELNTLVERGRSARAPTEVPDPTAATAGVGGALAALDEQLAAMGVGLDRLGLPARDARGLVAELRDAVGATRAQAEAIERPEAARLAEVLRSGEAALVVTSEPPGPGRRTIAAIEMEALFPPAAFDAARGLSIAGEAGRRAEGLFTDALAALADPTPPIVVFVHGEPQRFVGRAGVLRELSTRLRSRGIDVAEWAVAVDPERPGPNELDATGARPVVWVVISPNSAAGSQPLPDGSLGASGTERARAVGDAVADLVADGEPVLININPSVFPTFGAEDPVAAHAASFGIRADAGRPILGSSPTGAATDAGVRTDSTSGHPVAAAASGLAITLPWAIGLELGAGAVPLVRLDDPSAWSESQWLRLWQIPAASRSLLADQPVFGEGDGRGPWVVAAAGERDGARLVVVGSNTWMLDARWSERRAVDGRVVTASPGNPELFEAAVLWLAGKDGLIGRGVEAGGVPRIRELDGATLSTLRWGLVLGPAGVALLGGIALRVTRR